MHVNTYNETPKTDEQCAICFEDLLKRRERFCRTQHIFGKCCKNGWYHKDCLQRYANSAGYFFKCPLCNDITEFKTVTFWGISVPNRDALWEDNDAYADQMEIPTDCVAQNCVNPSGRKGNLRTLLYCLLCGSNPSHTMCTMMKSEDYCCEACSGVLHKPDEAKPNKEHNDADPLEDFVFRANTIRLNPTNQPQTETQAPQPQTLTLLCAQDTSDSEDSSGSDSDSESDFDCFLSQLSKQTNEKENVDMAAQPLNINMIPSIDEPLRMRNRRRTAPTARRAQDTATEPRRLRSRSNNNRGRPSLSPEAVDRRNNNEERGSARNRRRTQNDAENTNTGTSRGRSRIRTFGSQVRSRGPSPLDISCVANRTRARSRK
ncbi:PHD finger protein 7 [Drosophila navojoa]|uniref:PHD finger protein 7 n=1 Tax=Drosophila navojoa TaxID=7232 RepID=UPI0008470F0F|nr:PHD finger protein 7 [Drosophila navojoa]